jgi:hypothetical protein
VPIECMTSRGFKVTGVAFEDSCSLGVRAQRRRCSGHLNFLVVEFVLKNIQEVVQCWALGDSFST